MTKRTKILLGCLAVAIIVAGAFFLYKPAVAPDLVSGENATSTPEGTNTGGVAPGGKDGLPAEPVFTLPDGAQAIDDYSFIQNDQVYFRSLTSPNPLAIPNSDAGTFERLTPFMVSPDLTIVAACGASGSYAFYSDAKSLYFYQYWRAPEFRSSQIEVVANIAPKDFEKLSDTLYSDGENEFKIGYKKATTTCSYILQR